MRWVSRCSTHPTLGYQLNPRQLVGENEPQHFMLRIIGIPCVIPAYSAQNSAVVAIRYFALRAIMNIKQSGVFMRTFTATQAKQNFGELLDALDSDDVSIVRNGREVAVVSSPKRKRPLPDILEAKRKIIQSYFNGEITRCRAMAIGDYQRYSDLLEDAGRLSISMPELPEAEIDRMVGNVLQILNSAGLH